MLHYVVICCINNIVNTFIDHILQNYDPTELKRTPDSTLRNLLCECYVIVRQNQFCIQYWR